MPDSAESVAPPDVCPCCRFSRTDVVGQRCAWCGIAGCRTTCRRQLVGEEKRYTVVDAYADTALRQLHSDGVEEQP